MSTADTASIEMTMPRTMQASAGGERSAASANGAVDAAAVKRGEAESGVVKSREVESDGVESVIEEIPEPGDLIAGPAGELEEPAA